MKLHLKLLMHGMLNPMLILSTHIHKHTHIVVVIFYRLFLHVPNNITSYFTYTLNNMVWQQHTLVHAQIQKHAPIMINFNPLCMIMIIIINKKMCEYTKLSGGGRWEREHVLQLRRTCNGKTLWLCMHVCVWIASYREEQHYNHPHYLPVFIIIITIIPFYNTIKPKCLKNMALAHHIV